MFNWVIFGIKKNEKNKIFRNYEENIKMIIKTNEENGIITVTKNESKIIRF